MQDASIDLIVSNNGLNNVSDLDKALFECSRIIKKEGQFIQTMNLNNTMMEFYTVMESVLKELKLEDCLNNLSDHIYKKRKPVDEYLEKIELYGFEVKEVKHHQFEYTFVDGTSMLNHYFIRLAFMDSWKNIVPEEKQQIVFQHIESELNKQSDIDGIMNLTVPFVLINCVKS